MVWKPCQSRVDEWRICEELFGRRVPGPGLAFDTWDRFVKIIVDMRNRECGLGLRAVRVDDDDTTPIYNLNGSYLA